MAVQSFADLARDMDQVEKLGKWIVQSKFFACDYEGQGLIIATECYLTGQTPLEYFRRNKMVNGKPFVQYDAMLAGFRERGGYHKVLKNTADEASIEFVTKTGEKHVVSLTWEELSKEPVPYGAKGLTEADIVAMLAAGKTPQLKTKYATPRSRATMLFARLVSASIRVLCPEVNFGMYTEEEMEDVETKPVATQWREEAASAVNAKIESRFVEPKETVVKTTEPVVAPKELETINVTALLAPDEGPQSIKITSPIGEEQYDRIIQLVGQLKAAGETDIVERVKAKLVASGLEKIRDLNIAEGELLIQAMEVKSIGKWFESSLKGHKSPS
ncbi:MAG: hypothetical protein ACOVLE_02910 [Pirellula staleyi]